MIARSALPLTLRSIIDRFGLAATTQRGGRSGPWQRMIAALEDWWTTSYLAWRSEIPSGDHAERLCRFCQYCGEDTPKKALMSSASAGLLKYTAAGIAGDRA